MIDDGKNKRGVLDMVTTAILLITFIIVIIFITVSIAMIRVQGNAAGTVLLTVSIGSTYEEQRSILYQTDDYGNKVTDMIGQALLIGNAKITMTGHPDIRVPSEATTNTKYTCPSAGTKLYQGTYGSRDAAYDTTTIKLNDYIHCYIIPKKLAKMYGTNGYCMHIIYDEGGANIETIYGNETLGCATEKKVTADLAPPPGFKKPIYMRLVRV
jgi:hypothetical protein